MVIFGTAGHIDHGKTSVIQGLTGIDADRLPEEKSRGLTIDLGFAWLETTRGEKIGIIDVPGHENYIRNMITGITTVDAFLLVVDGKEGWMPQTEEHFQIIRLLDINYGLVIITKTDLASPERIAETEQQIKDKITGINKFNIPILKFSINDKDSIDLLRHEVESVSSLIPLKKDLNKPRLFVDRVFEIKGSGTVVTGTLLDGNLYQNQSATLFPSKKTIRIRQIQSYNDSVEKAILSSRVALNLSGIKKEEVRRGDLISGLKALPSGNFLDVSFVLLPQESPSRLKNGTEVEFISHTKILRGTIIFSQKEMLSGEKSYVQLRFKEPLWIIIGDHFIIRLPGSNETIGGGRVLALQEDKHSFHNPYWEKWLESRSKLDINSLILSELEKYKTIKKGLLLLNSPFSQVEIYQHLDNLNENSSLFLIDDRVVNNQFWNELIIRVLANLKQKHSDYPLKKGFPSIQLKNELPGLSEELFDNLLKYLVEENSIAVKDGMVSLFEHTIELTESEEKVREEILQYLNENINSLPTEKELQNVFSKNIEMINYLKEMGEVIKLADDICLTPAIYENMKDEIVAFLKKNKSITIGQVRDLLHISRKYIVPLLTRMDEEGITKRIGNERTLC